MTNETPTPTVQKYLFVHEGQSVEVEPEIAEDAELLRRLVSTWAPAAKTGELSYSEPDARGAVTITLLARAQPKGVQVVEADPLAALLQAQAGENPVLVLYRRLNDLYAGADEPVEIFVTQAEIEQKLDIGRKENARMGKICQRLQKAEPAEAPSAPAAWS